MPRRVRRVRRGAVLASVVATIAVGTAITGGVTNFGFGSPDEQAPVARMTAPANLATVSGSTVAVTAFATDNVGVTSVQFRINDQNLGNPDTNGGDGWSTTWDTTGYANGSWQLTAVATDAAGLFKTSSAFTVTVSNAGGGGGGGGGAQVIVSTTGNDTTCVRNDATKPCLTFNKAYQVANQGDTVSVGCGTYAAQTINNDASKIAATDVVFDPATATAGCMTINGTLAILAKHLTINKPTMLSNSPAYTNILLLDTPADDVTVTGPKAPKLEAGQASNWLISGGDFGPCVADYAQANNGVCNSRVAAASSGTIQDTSFHDYGVIGAPHSECLAVFGADGLNLYRDKFWNCEDSASVLVQANSGIGMNVTDLHIIGNWVNTAFANNDNTFTTPKGTSFDITNSALRGSYIFSFNSLCSQCEILWIGTGNSGVTSSTIVGNIGMNVGSCPSGMTADYNVYVPFSAFTGQTACGTNQQKWSSTGQANLPYQNNSFNSSMDYHLQTTTDAKFDNLIPTSVAGGCPATDIDGASRPASTNCDAGSDER